MKFLYVLFVLMVFVSACAQQAVEQPPAVSPEQEPTAEPEAEAEAEAPVEAPEEVVEEVPTVTTDEVRILGKAGFEPLELTIAAGSAVTWYNDDAKDIVFTMFKDGKFYINSDVIKPGEQFELEFTEAGEYEYWTLAYGPVGAKITVE